MGVSVIVGVLVATLIGMFLLYAEALRLRRVSEESMGKSEFSKSVYGELWVTIIISAAAAAACFKVMEFFFS